MVTSGSPVDSSAPTAARPAPPYALVAAVAAVGVLLAVGMASIVDVDLPWHVIIGQEILDGTPPAQAGRGWSFNAAPDTWVSTQWLAEVMFAWLHDVGGWTATILWRYLTTVAIIAVTAVVVLRGRTSRATTAPFVIAILPLVIYAQERSVQLTFLLAPLLGAALLRGLRTGVLPRWWLVAVIVLPWANFHGGWVLVPVCLVLLAVGRWLDHGWRDQSARQALVVLLPVSLIAASITPSGPGNLLTAVRFGDLPGLISEWGRTTLWSLNGGAVGLMLLVVAWAWARGAVRPPRSEVLVVIALTAFGLMAFRNVPVTVLMLAPIVADRLDVSFRTGEPARLRDTGSVLALAMGAMGAVGGLVLAMMATPYPADTIPDRLMTQVRSLPGEVRLLNAYNVSGTTLYWGDPGRILVGIDGRADRYGAEEISRYISMLNGGRNWREDLNAMDPDAALLEADDALRDLLVLDRGWREVGRQKDWVLLVRPGLNPIPLPPPGPTSPGGQPSTR